MPIFLLTALFYGTEARWTAGSASGSVNATLAGSGEALLTLSANDGTRVAIDPSWPSQYLADLDAGPGVEDYLLVANPTATATTARLTYVRPDGSGATRDVAVGAGGRLSIPLGSDPVIGGQGLVSVAVRAAGRGARAVPRWLDGGPSTPPFRRRSGPGLP